MEILLSFILSTQVGLSVYAVMRYREVLALLAKKSSELLSCQVELFEALEKHNTQSVQISDIQRDITFVKAKLTLGGK
jgi:prefoldin subunit 5